MLKLIYFSNVSGNTHRFVERFLLQQEQAHEPAPDILRLPIRGEQPKIEEDYILLCPTYGTSRTSHVPPQVKKFLADEGTRNHCVGVIGSGNINFGHEFGAAANMIAMKLQIPVLMKIDLGGEPKDLAQMHKLMQLDRETIDHIERNRQPQTTESMRNV